MRSAHPSTSSGRVRRKTALIMVVFGLVAAACGGSAPTNASVTGGTSAATTEATPTAADGLVGEFATFDDTSLDLASLQGEDVVLWFWAPW